MDKKSIKKTWNVYGQKVKVKFVNDLVHPETHQPLYGLFDPERNAIYIRDGLDLKMTNATLYHELGHALMFRLGMTQTTLDMNLHELIVEGFGNFIAENFKAK